MYYNLMLWNIYISHICLVSFCRGDFYIKCCYNYVHVRNIMFWQDAYTTTGSGGWIVPNCGGYVSVSSRCSPSCLLALICVFFALIIIISVVFIVRTNAFDLYYKWFMCAACALQSISQGLLKTRPVTLYTYVYQGHPTSSFFYISSKHLFWSS